MAEKLTERQLEERRSLYGGFGNGQSQAFELALAPVVLGLIGFGLDHLLGILPVLTIVCGVMGVGGTGVKAYYGYTQRMQVEEAKLLGERR